MNTETTRNVQGEIDRVVREARAARAETMRAVAGDLSAAIKRFFTGFHRPAPHNSAAA